MKTNHTPQSIAAHLATLWLDTIEGVEITEDLLCWSVEITVKPCDGRRRSFKLSEIGESREEAIETLITKMSDRSWWSIFEITARPV